MSDPFIDSIFQWTQDFRENKELLFNAVLQVNAKVVVELGTDVGDSTRIFASALARTQGHLWTIDINRPDWEHQIIRRVNTALGIDTTEPSPMPEVMRHFAQFITVITSNSLQVNWRSWIDLLFIDSNHEATHVSSELEKYGSLVRKEGLILLHDTHHRQFGEGIRKSLEEWAKAKGKPFKYFVSDKPEENVEGNIIRDNGLGVIYV